LSRCLSRAAATALLLLPMCLTALWAAYLYLFSYMPMFGDEPHYVLIADSIFYDRDLNVRNNYEKDAARPYSERILQTDDWTAHAGGHLQERGDALYGKHEPGLGFFLAVPYGLFGRTGAKFGMIFFIGLAPFLFYWIARRIAGSAGWAIVIALSLSLGLPVSLASIHVYVDMLAGLLILLAVECLYRIYKAGPEEPTAPLFVVTVLALWALPWLKISFALPVALCTAAAMAMPFRGGLNAQALKKAAVRTLPALSVLLFLVYLKVVFGHFSHPNARAVKIEWEAVYNLLRLHFDFSQGLIIEQPLLFLGLTGCAVLWRLDRLFALFLLVLYLSIMGPNAAIIGAHGFAPMGRYAWSSYPLWIYPLCAFFAVLSSRGRVVFGLVCAANLVFQALRAPSYLENPALTYYPLRLPEVFARYPNYVPDFESHLRNVPAVIGAWLGLGLLFFALGFFWTRRGRRVFSFALPAYAILALLGLHTVAVRQNVWVWEAETMLMQGGVIPRHTCNLEDEEASGGRARSCPPLESEAEPFFLVRGPCVNLSADHTYEVTYYLKAAECAGSRDCLAVLTATEGTEGNELGRILVTPRDLAAPQAYEPFRMRFKSLKPLGWVQFCVLWRGSTQIWIDRIELKRID